MKSKLLALGLGAALALLAVNDARAGGAIASAETVAGSFSPGAYQDSWTFEGAQNQRVVITTAEITGSVSPEIWLYRPSDGGLETSQTGAGTWHILEHQLAETGTYTITIKENGANTSGYFALALAIIGGASTSATDTDGGAITSGATMRGTLVGEADTDIFTFTGTTGDRCIITTTALSGYAQPEIWVYPPGGGSYEASYSGPLYGPTLPKRLEWDLDNTGTYTIVVNDNSLNAEGSYALALAKIPGATSSTSDPDGGAITSGATKIGYITYRADTDIYTFSGAIGDRVIITTSNASGYVQPQIYLYPPSGAVEYSALTPDYTNKIEGLLAQSGTYTIIVDDNGMNVDSGAYAISLAQIPGDTSSASDADGGTIASGANMTGMLNLSDTDLYRFYGQAGDRVVITTASYAYYLAPEIRLYSPGGATLEASKTGTASFFRLDRQLNQTGIYTIMVMDNGWNSEGSYGIALARLSGPTTSPDDAQGGPIESGQTLLGCVNYKSDTDLFQFYAKAGERAIIQTTRYSGAAGGYVHPEIYLYPPGNGPAEKSSLGEKDTHKIDYVLTHTGIHTILVGDYNMDGTGYFNLTLTKLPPDLPTGIHHPFPPEGAAVADMSDGLRWDAVAGATGYDINFGDQVLSQPPVVVVNHAGNYLPFGDISPTPLDGKDYYWRITAHTPSGDMIGPWFRFKTEAAPLEAQDDFADGNIVGDTDWYEVAGRWKVNLKKVYLSNVKYVNYTIYQNMSGLITGRITAKIKTSPMYYKYPNADIMFGVQYAGSSIRFRFARLKWNKLILGQKGDYGGEIGGNKKGKRRAGLIGVGKPWLKVIVDIHPSGLVEVFLNNETTPTVSYPFARPVTGWPGFGAWGAKALFDDFYARGDAYIPQ